MRMCLVILLMATANGRACLWDRDTLAEEASGYLETINVLTGRFPRNPPIYYAKRLERVRSEIGNDPRNLALYDDAGVACDRLHMSEQAIEWMQQKAAVLAEREDKEHRYRYHANLGTFLIHAWLRDGAKLENPRGEEGAEHIRRAIAINPDAHFGRETIQLKAIEWLLEERAEVDAIRDEMSLRPNILRQDPYPGVEIFDGAMTAAEAVKGLTGMVALGAAWESVDIFHAISIGLSIEEHASMAYIASLRSEELLADGKKSYAVAFPIPYQRSGAKVLEKRDHLDAWFKKARTAADKWQAARTTYMEREIEKGKHPDTHADFWKSFDEEQHALPDLTERSPSAYERTRKAVRILAVFVCLALFVLWGFQRWRGIRAVAA